MLIFWLFLSLFPHAHAQNCAEQSVDVFIVAGQSNAVGSTTDEVPPEKQNILSTNANKLTWNFKTNKIEELKIGVNNNLLHGWTGTIGIEGPFAQAYLEKKDKKFIVFKYAEAGTSLHFNWNARTQGSLYQQMIEASGRLKAELAKTGLTPCYKAFFWLQGESDKGEYAKYYHDHMRDLINDLRSDLASPELPIFISRIGMEEDTKKFDNVQDDLAKEDTKIRVIESRDLLKREDHVHFTTASLIVLGERFYSSYEAYRGSIEDTIGGELKAWPVPLSFKEVDHLTIAYRTQTYCSETSLVIYDLLGRVVHQVWNNEYLESSSQLVEKTVSSGELNHLTDGLYLITLRLDHCDVQSGKKSKLITQKILIFK